MNGDTGECCFQGNLQLQIHTRRYVYIYKCQGLLEENKHLKIKQIHGLGLALLLISITYIKDN